MTVDISITDLHVGEPIIYLLGVKGLKPSGEAVIGCILKLQCMGQVLCSHETQDRAEALSEVKPGIWFHLLAYTRGKRGVIDLPWLNEPSFILFK